MTKRFKKWLKYQKIAYIRCKERNPTWPIPDYNTWLKLEIKERIKWHPKELRTHMKEFMRVIQDDILWNEHLKKYLKELNKSNDSEGGI